MEQQTLQKFQRDSEWFHSNIKNLQDEGFIGKFVAIKNSKPIASNKDINLVLEELDRKGEDPSLLFIEFVHPREFTLIL